MKLKILLLTLIGTAGCIYSKASNFDPRNPGKGIINEVSGSVIDADTKKPLKEVTVTAYLTSKKEKFIITDELGRFDFDELKSGIYKLVFEKEGYRKVTKEKISIKTDETFQMRIEMIEEEDFDLMPSPFHFIDTK
jgi:5-hydroxyisourate hydrolase-like protein (transthyretin family)